MYPCDCSCRVHLLFAEEQMLTQKLHDAQLRLYDIEEEKNAWLLFVRQALVDWEFLDSSVLKCYPSSSRLNVANGVKQTVAADNPFDDDVDEPADNDATTAIATTATGNICEYLYC